MASTTRSLLLPLRCGLAVDKTPIGPASYLTRGGSRRDLESEEVTTPEEIFVDAREKEEDEEVFLEAIQTDRVREAEEEERARERERELSPSPSPSPSSATMNRPGV